MPAAPGLLSTIIVVPRALPALSAKARITTSVEPPAGHGQISLTGRAGNACARTIAGKDTAAVPASELLRKSRRENFNRVMVCLLYLNELLFKMRRNVRSY